METDIWGQLALEASTVYVTDGSNVKRSPFAETVQTNGKEKLWKKWCWVKTDSDDVTPQFIKLFFRIQFVAIHLFSSRFQTIDKLPDKVLLNIFSYLSHREICRMARVCRRWRQIAYDTRLWRNVSLRPEVSGLHVGSLESLLTLIQSRFGASLRYIELPIELITHTVLHELAAKCPNLTHMLLDFSTGENL